MASTMSQNEMLTSFTNKIGGTRMNITALGIDIAKNIFELHAIDLKGKLSIWALMRFVA